MYVLLMGRPPEKLKGCDKVVVLLSAWVFLVMGGRGDWGMTAWRGNTLGLGGLGIIYYSGPNCLAVSGFTLPKPAKYSQT